MALPESGAPTPKWAKSPVVRNALESQRVLNPDEIFGPMKPLELKQLFNKDIEQTPHNWERYKDENEKL